MRITHRLFLSLLTFMKHTRYLAIFFIISFFILLFSCTNTRKENDKQDVNATELEEKKDLAPLTCDFVYFDKNKNAIIFRYNNNSNFTIGLIDFAKFEYKDKSEWKEILLKPDIRGYVGGEPVISAGGDYFQYLFLKFYVMDSVTNNLRVVQLYHIDNYEVENDTNNMKILYKNFTLSQLGIDKK